MTTPYDQVPYPCNAYAQTHPEWLATVARLRGLRAPAARTCRYLEIGCGDGGNLLPLASVLPEGQFLGLDLAATSIETARLHARGFGLENVEFLAGDLLSLNFGGRGKWDYIVAHGFFSWVPPPVRLRLLQLCQEVLAPDGIAFISYNAYPGCHVRQMAREIMRYHTENAPDAAAKIGQARAMMSFLAQSNGMNDEYGALWRAEAERVRQYAPNHLYHDDLAEVNQPYYLHEFADLAASHGLQYLGDADYASMFATRHPVELRQQLAEIGPDPVRREQYLDFIKCRRFRQTLLCHAHVQVQDTAPVELMEELFFASSVKPVGAGANLWDESEVAFEGRGGLECKAALPVAKLALACLGAAWPARLSFTGLLQAVEESLAAAVEAEVLATVVREFIEMGVAEACLEPHSFATTVEERPLGAAWARYQLRAGQGGITTLRHNTVHIRDPFGQWLLDQLDGNRTGEEISLSLASTVKPDAEGRLDFDKELQEARQLVAEGLEKFADLGLLAKG